MAEGNARPAGNIRKVKTAPGPCGAKPVTGPLREKCLFLFGVVDHYVLSLGLSLGQADAFVSMQTYSVNAGMANAGQ